ncbi:MAG TPA: TolC family protein [Terracidiphilus sp.]|jgi:outer membrane protein
MTVYRSIISTGALIVLLFLGGTAGAQQESKSATLPNAPAPHLIAQLAQSPISPTETAASPQVPTQPGFSAQTAPAGTTQQGTVEAGPKTKLTHSQAEQMAIKNNPQVTVARLLALAQHQVSRETRSAELPTGNAALTAVEAEEGSRISAGSLTASRLFEHAGVGGGFSQLLTDFGRTRNLVASSVLLEKAQKANAIATQYDIQLATDQAFYNALQALQTLKVAQQNVVTRQTLQSQVNQMTINKLKSTLDLSFADVNLSQAKLLSLDAQNNADSTMAALDAVLGIDHQVNFDLIDEGSGIPQPPPDVDQLVEQSLKQRPDLQATMYSQQAAVKFSHAQRDQLLPSIAASGTVGSVPIRPGQFYLTNWWGGIGVNINIPVFNGFLYTAQAKEASIRAQAASERTRDLRDRIARDVRTAWLAANTSYQKVSVTAELLKEADLGLTLAKTRYQMGLSSIVELSQAEYQQTDAAIGNANAQYQYRLALATLNYQIGSEP